MRRRENTTDIALAEYLSHGKDRDGNGESFCRSCGWMRDWDAETSRAEFWALHGAYHRAELAAGRTR